MPGALAALTASAFTTEQLVVIGSLFGAWASYRLGMEKLRQQRKPQIEDRRKPPTGDPVGGSVSPLRQPRGVRTPPRPKEPQ